MACAPASVLVSRSHADLASFIRLRNRAGTGGVSRNAQGLVRRRRKTRNSAAFIIVMNGTRREVEAG
jgi:hypothetical protein